MKLLVIASLIAVSAAARLEHLEQQQRLRAYLPPHRNSGLGSTNGFGSNNSFGSNNGFGSTNSFGSSRRLFESGTSEFGSASAFGRARSNRLAFNPQTTFPGASDRYLPPDHSTSSTVGVPRFAGSGNGIGAQGTSSQFSRQNTFGAPSRYQAQSSAVNRQYLASHSAQNIPQQAFDEQTGYQY